MRVRRITIESERKVAVVAALDNKSKTAIRRAMLLHDAHKRPNMLLDCACAIYPGTRPGPLGTVQLVMVARVAADGPAKTRAIYPTNGPCAARRPLRRRTQN